MNMFEQIAYDQGQKETEAHLKSQLLVVCRSFCLQTWIEALNVAGVNSNSQLRNLEKAFYPPTIRARPISHPSISTSGPTPTSSAENPPPKSSTTAPTQSKPAEQQPSTLLLPRPRKPSQLSPSLVQLLHKALMWQPRCLKQQETPQLSQQPKWFFLLQLQLLKHGPPLGQGHRRLPRPRECSNGTILLLTLLWFFFFFFFFFIEGILSLLAFSSICTPFNFV